MHKPLLPALIILIVVLLSHGFGGSAQLQVPGVIEEARAYISPDVLEALERESEVEALISLKQADIPFAARTQEDRRQNTAQRQARVLSVLNDADFTLTHQFELAAALGGLVTKSGVQKLATHPDVVDVALSRQGSVSLGESVPLINASPVIFLGINGAGVDVAVLDTGRRAFYDQHAGWWDG